MTDLIISENERVECLPIVTWPKKDTMSIPFVNHHSLSELLGCSAMRFHFFLAVAISWLVVLHSPSVTAQTTIGDAKSDAKPETSESNATKPSPGSLYFDGFSDLNGSTTLFKNGLMKAGGTRRTREIYPYANKSNDPILLEVIEDVEMLGADGLPGVLSFAWQSTPASLEYSGFVFLGGAQNKLKLPRISAVKSRSELDSFHLRYRYKGRSKASDSVNFQIGCRIEPGENDAFASRIDMPAILVKDQWQDFSMALGSGSNVKAFLKALAKNPGDQFKVVWSQVGPIAGYQEGDTLFIDDLEIVESEAIKQDVAPITERIATRFKRIPFQPVDGLTPLDLTKVVALPIGAFEKQTVFPWPVAPQGDLNIAEIPVRVDGALFLHGQANAALGGKFPEKVSDISCQQTFESLYILHGGFYPSKPGEPVFQIVFNYTNGKQHSDTISYGDDVLDWYIHGDSEIQIPTAKRSCLGWVAEGKSNDAPQLIRFNMSEVSNPHPTQLVESIDLVSSDGRTAGCIMAMTVGKSGMMKSKLKVRQAGRLFFDDFSDTNGSKILIKNGESTVSNPRPTRMAIPFAGSSTDPIALETFEDSTSTGPDGKPGLLSLSWKEIPSKLDYSGFIYSGTEKSPFRFPTIAASSSRRELDGFEVKFRYKGVSKGRVEFDVSCHFETWLQDAYRSRIDLDTLSVTNQWQEFSAKLGSAEDVNAFLQIQSENPSAQFRIVWQQVGPISHYRAGDTLLIDDLTIHDSLYRFEFDVE